MSFFDMLSGFLGGDNSNQSAYIQQLQQLVNGQGPNPAQQMLNQQTNRNDLMGAGQIGNARGLSPALQARQISQNNAANQQAAVGQGATLQAQQSYNALGQVGTAINQQAQNDSAFGKTVIGAALSATGAGGALSSLGGPGGGAAPAGALTGSTGLSSAGGGGGTPNMVGDIWTGPLPGHASGGIISGKAMVRGDSPQNDTVPARVSPGEIVLPRSVTMAPDAAARAAAFVEAIKKKHGAEEEPEGYARVVAAKKRAKR